MATNISNPALARKAFSRTANSPTSSFLLGRDLLWHIFLINADMEDDSEDIVPAINTLKRSSQVCSTWRDLIINSASLWGRVVNFDWLHQEEWRKEVMYRTGNSGLFLRGGQIWGLAGIDHAIVSILSSNWFRVRSLNLDFDNSSDPQIVRRDSGLWGALGKPSDVLQSFRLRLLVRDPDEHEHKFIKSPPDFIIFGDHAPSLRTFNAPNIRLNIRAHWMSGIRCLSLNTTPIPVHELLEALTHMPFLEILEDQGVQAITHGDPHQMRKVTLPQLKCIILKIRSNVRPYFAFLAQIEPARGRLLEFTCYARSDTLNAQDIIASSQVLSTYSSQAVVSASTTINLHFRRMGFLFSTQLTTRKLFYFDLLYSPTLAGHAGTKLWNALNFPIFLCASLLSLHLSESFPVLPSDPKIAEFITAVGSVVHLETTSPTLGFLLRLPAEFLMIAFPMVHTISILQWLRPLDDVEPLHDFLSFRSTLGRPISCLYVDGYYDRLDLTTFEKFTGLKVIFPYHLKRSREYICGGGRPEELLVEESCDSVSQ